MTRDILVVGGGGHARSVIDVLEAEGRFAVAGVVAATAPPGHSLFGYPWLGTDNDLAPLVAQCRFAVVAVGQLPRPTVRMSLFQKLVDLGAELPVIKSPHAIVSPRASLERGTVVMHGAVVNAGAAIGENCIVNSMALVEHDTIVGNHCHVATGARINGGCTVGAESFIGSGAILFQRAQVPVRSVVSAGSIVKPRSQATP